MRQGSSYAKFPTTTIAYLSNGSSTFIKFTIYADGMPLNLFPGNAIEASDLECSRIEFELEWITLDTIRYQFNDLSSNFDWAKYELPGTRKLIDHDP
jgi:hypothetical protein